MLIQRLTVYKQTCDDNSKAATILPFYRHHIEMSNAKKSLDIGNNAENIPGEICASDSVLEAMTFSSHSAIDNEDCMKGEAIL